MAKVEKAEEASQADRIRKFALERWITPARAEGKTAITIRAGDVHRAMGLANAMPAVCSALGSNKFASVAGVTLLRTEGPAAGANVYFYFTLFRVPPPDLVALVRPDATRPTAKPDIDLDLRGSLVLVSCVKSKLPHAAPARELYTSAWFSKVRDLVEASGSPWFILSSRYGLVAPHEKIEPYEYTLNTVGVEERRKWAAMYWIDYDPTSMGASASSFSLVRAITSFSSNPFLLLGWKLLCPWSGFDEESS